MRTKAHSQNRFMRIISIPFRVLGKAKDLYVRGLTDCAARGYGNNMGGPTTMPRSFSVASSRSYDGDDYQELVRAASARSLGHSVDLDMLLRQAVAAKSKTVPRSCSVGMGRIDEEKPCDFGEANHKVKADKLYPRSRSYAVTKRSVGF